MNHYRNFLKTGALALALLLPAWPADKPAQDQTITRQQADTIINELRQMRQLLEKLVPSLAPTAPSVPAPEPAAKAELKINGGYSLGAKDALLTMVEFTDYQCTFCRQFHLTTFDQIRKQYIDTGKVRFISRDLPLDFHSNAFKAAEAARCAGDQNQFWKMRDTLIANADKLSPDEILGYAQNLYLDMPTFKTCLDSGKHKDAIQREMAEAGSLNISGTPSFIIGKTTREGVNGVVVVGALPFATYDARLKEFEAAK